MNILVWGINYAPEVTGIAPCNTALCRYLLTKGHDVCMVTAFPYYPAWRLPSLDRWKIFRTDLLDGVRVHRCWLYVPVKPTVFRRLVHEASFVFSSFLRVIFLPRPDLVIVISPPLALGVAAWLACLIKRSRYVFHVQDLQPDAGAALGLLKRGFFMRMLLWLESFAYRKAALVSGISPGMVATFQQKGVPPEKCLYFPNSIKLSAVSGVERNSFRKRHGLCEGEFLAVYSGNFGAKQGLDILLEAASRLRGHPVRIILCGEGHQRERIVQRIKQWGLENVILLPLLPEPEYQSLLADANLCLITQQLGTGRCFFPSKLLPALARGRPILAAAEADSELARAVIEGGFGTVTPPNDPDKLAAVLLQLLKQPEQLEKWGQAALSHVRQFDAEIVHARFFDELTNKLFRCAKM